MNRIEGKRDKQSPDMMTRTLYLRGSTVDAEARTVEAVLSTENPVRVLDIRAWQEIDEVLLTSGARLPPQMPLLDSHVRSGADSVLGSIRNMGKENRQTIGVLHFADEDERAESSFRKVRQGHITDVSIGYRYGLKDFVQIDPGEERSIGGTTYRAGDVPLRIVRKWAPHEGSLVPIGADAAAKIRESMAGLSARNREKFDMNEKLRIYLATLGLREDATDAEAKEFFDGLEGEKRTLADALSETTPPAGGDPGEGTRGLPRPDPPASSTPAEPVPDVAEIARAAVAEAVVAVQARSAHIRTLGGDDVPAAIVETAIREQWDDTRISKEFLAAVRSARPAPLNQGGGTLEVGRHLGDNMVRDLENALYVRIGGTITDEALRREAEPFRGIGMRALCEICVRSEGADPGFSPQVLYERAVSTVSLPLLLAGATRRTLQRAYGEYPSTARRWTGTREVSDFREYKDIHFSEFASTPIVGPGGEIASGGLKESSESYSADTFARRITLSRQHIINDDLGGFLDIPKKLGRAAARNIDDLVYALVVSASGVGPTMNEDSEALFSLGAARISANYATGAGSVLGDTGMIAAKLLMRKTRGLATEEASASTDTAAFLNLDPRFLLVPAALESTARKITVSEHLIVGIADTGDQTTVLTPNVNIHRGTVEVIPEPRLDAGTNGGTAWYLAADPADQDNVVIVSLLGETGPTIETQTLFDSLGMGWRMFHDAGVAAVNWRGIVRNKGA